MAPNPFADAEAVGLALFAPVGKTVQTTPETITEKLVQVVKIGGANDGRTDRSDLLVQYFGTGDTAYGEARTMAAQGDDIVLAAGGTAVTVSGYPKPILIDRAEILTAPVEVAYQDPQLRRKTARYRLTMRRPR